MLPTRVGLSGAASSAPCSRWSLDLSTSSAKRSDQSSGSVEQGGVPRVLQLRRQPLGRGLGLRRARELDRPVDALAVEPEQRAAQRVGAEVAGARDEQAQRVGVTQRVEVSKEGGRSVGVALRDRDHELHFRPVRRQAALELTPLPDEPHRAEDT